MNLTDTKKEEVRDRINNHLSKREYEKALTLIKHFKIANYCVTKGTMKKEYKIPQKVLDILPSNSADNPHYKCASPMILYLKPEFMKDVLGEYLLR